MPPRVALPLTFEHNAGQIANEFDYLIRAAAYDAAFHSRGVTFALKDPANHDASIVALAFRGAHASRPAAQAPLRGRINYLRGSSEQQWIRNVPTYERVKYRDLYPDIDLVFYGTEQQLEYDFLVAPHADPSRIAMTFDGADDVRANGEGDLIVSTAGRVLVQKRPIAFQEREGVRTAVDASYAIAADRAVTIRLGAYDRTQPLTIDPMIVLSRHFGGTGGDSPEGAIVKGGALYLAGTTCSTDFPTQNAMQPVHRGTNCDGFITKMTGDGLSVIYSTYLGGSDHDRITALAVDSSGAVYVGGPTFSPDFPTTPGAFDRTCSNDGQCTSSSQTFPKADDGFVSKISPDGARLVYSTYIGGTDDEDILALAVNSAGQALLTGLTRSADYPTTAGAIQTGRSGFADAIITKLAADGGSLVYSTYFGGGGNNDIGFGATFDAAGNAWITGETDSGNMPVVGAFQPSLGNAAASFVTDAFVVKLTPANALALSTYFGGDGSDHAFDIATDASGVYLVGDSSSTTTPGASGTRDVTAKGNAAFIAQLAADGSHVVRTRLLDGRSGEIATTIGITRFDSTLVFHIAGTTSSTDFPVTPDAFQKTLGVTDASGDLFYATFQLDAGGALAPATFASLFGAQGTEGGFPQLATDGLDGAFVVTSSNTTFPMINNPLSPSTQGIVIVHLQPRNRWTESTAGEVHLYASDATAVGSEWSLVADSSAADGRRAANVDRGAAKVATPLMNPSSYAEFTFDADAGTAYRVWMRGEAANNSYSNDSVFAQFSDSVDASGNAVWRIGSTSATPMILEDCLGCNVHGWGWSDNGYGVGVLGPTVRFASTGRHTVRFQAREDGLSIDQVVLSSAQNLSTAPGTTKDDTTVVKRTITAAPPDETCVAGEVVMHMTGTAGAGNWSTVSDPAAASGVRMFQPDAGAPKITTASASPANYFEKTFAADANTNYRIWIRGEAQNDFWGNDSVFVQFSDSQDTNGAATWRIATNSAAEVNLEDCSGCGLKSWGWQDNGWGVGVAGPLVRFSASGTHTIRIQTREDGFSIDQIVLSSTKYLSAAPGALKNDTMILPACPTPPLR